MTGFSWLGNAFHKMGSWLKANWQMVVVIVVAAILVCTGIGLTIGGAMFASLYGATGAVLTPALYMAGASAMTGGLIGTVTGALGAALAGGDMGDVLRGAVVGGISGALTGSLHNVGGTFALDSANVVGHGVVGGASNVAMGGKFGDGFLSASAAGTTAVSGLTDPETQTGKSLGFARRTAIASAAGGTVSALGGGKFANGAVTGAMTHLLNAESLDEMHRMSRRNGNEWSAEYKKQQLDYYLNLGLKDTNVAIVSLKFGLFVLDPAAKWFPPGSTEYEKFVANQYQSLQVAQMASFQLGDRPPEYHASLTAGFAFGYARQSGVTVDLNGVHPFSGQGIGWGGIIASFGIGKGAAPSIGGSSISASGGWGIGGSIDRDHCFEYQATTPGWSVMKNKY